MKKLMLLLLFLILLAVSVNAKQVTQTSITDLIDIRVPQADYLKLNSNPTLHTHVYNGTSGLLLTNSSTTCDVHIYNTTGNHILISRMGWEATEQEFELNISNTFNTTGLHSFIIQCNTSTVGGFVSGSFYVTESGSVEDNLDTTSGIAIVIFVLFASGIFLVLPFIKKPLTKNIFVDLILRRGCWLVGIFLMSLNSAMVATIAAESWLPLTQELFRVYMFIFNWGGYLLMFFMFFKTFLDGLTIWKVKKSKERYGDDDGE